MNAPRNAASDHAPSQVGAAYVDHGHFERSPHSLDWLDASAPSPPLPAPPRASHGSTGSLRVTAPLESKPFSVPAQLHSLPPILARKR